LLALWKMLGAAGQPVTAAGGQGEVNGTPSPGENARRDFVINKALLQRCPMEVWMYSVGRPSGPGLLMANEPEQTFNISGWDSGYTAAYLYFTGGLNPYFYGGWDPWETCYGGTWIISPCLWNAGAFVGGCYHHHRWVWVAGPPRRKPPVRIVHVPRGIGIIPRHPLDQKGKPPVNAKNGILVLGMENGKLQARMETPPAKGIHLRETVPNEFFGKKDLLAGIPKVAAPEIQGKILEKSLDYRGEPISALTLRSTENAIRYDCKSRGFVESGRSGNTSQNNEGGYSVVVARVGSHGVSGSVTGNGGGSRFGHSGGSRTGGSPGGRGGGSSSGGGVGHASGGSSGGHGGSGGGYSGGSGGGGGGHSGGGSSTSGGSPSGGGGGAHSH